MSERITDERLTSLILEYQAHLARVVASGSDVYLICEEHTLSALRELQEFRQIQRVLREICQPES